MDNIIKNTTITLQALDKNGQLHCKNGPAHVRHYTNGNLAEEIWVNHGIIHRINGPARIGYYSDGKPAYEYYMQNGKYHRKDGPSCKKYYSDGQLNKEYWHINGECHRDNEPAIIWYYPCGSVRRYVWMLNGNAHREGYPAEIWFYEKGHLKILRWCRHGKLYRENNLPAYVSYHANGKISEKTYINKSLMCRHTLFNENEEVYHDLVIINRNLSLIHKYKNSILLEKYYMQNYGNGSVLGPIKQTFYPNGQIRNEWHYNKKGQLHNTSGPAKISYRKDGLVGKAEYYINGRQFIKIT
jgi:hypothetical protein